MFTPPLEHFTARSVVMGCWSSAAFAFWRACSPRLIAVSAVAQETVCVVSSLRLQVWMHKYMHVPIEYVYIHKPIGFGKSFHKHKINYRC